MAAALIPTLHRTVAAGVDPNWSATQTVPPDRLIIDPGVNKIGFVVKALAAGGAVVAGTVNLQTIDTSPIQGTDNEKLVSGSAIATLVPCGGLYEIPVRYLREVTLRIDAYDVDGVATFKIYWRVLG